MFFNKHTKNKTKKENAKEMQMGGSKTYYTFTKCTFLFIILLNSHSQDVLLFSKQRSKQENQEKTRCGDEEKRGALLECLVSVSFAPFNLHPFCIFFFALFL